MAELETAALLTDGGNDDTRTVMTAGEAEMVEFSPSVEVSGGDLLRLIEQLDESVGFLASMTDLYLAKVVAAERGMAVALKDTQPTKRTPEVVQRLRQARAQLETTIALIHIQVQSMQSITGALVMQALQDAFVGQFEHSIKTGKLEQTFYFNPDNLVNAFLSARRLVCIIIDSMQKFTATIQKDFETMISAFVVEKKYQVAVRSAAVLAFGMIAHSGARLLQMTQAHLQPICASAFHIVPNEQNCLFEISNAPPDPSSLTPEQHAQLTVDFIPRPLFAELEDSLTESPAAAASAE